jgi:rSAM/selenodomain-associated transferase 1
MPTDPALLIFVKYPEPGKVKTRLAAAIGAELAAQLYHEFIRCTLDMARQLEVATRFVAFTPAEKEPDFKKLFPGPWQWFAQADSADLGVRIQRAIQYVQQQNYSHVLTIGTDSPSLPVAYLKQAITALANHDLVLGPATDGGYYLIGLKSAPPELFSEIDWSTERVFPQTRERAAQIKMSVHQLPLWYDVDDLAALRRFCEESPPPPALLKKLRPFL